MSTHTQGKHTPGPWFVEESETLGWHKVYVMTHDRAVIHNGAGFRGEHLEKIATAKANALLIAAAPDLLKALKGAVLSIENYERYIRNYNSAQVRAIEGMAPLYAAIDKAEGR